MEVIMKAFFLIAIAFAVIYTISTVRKYIEYKKLSPTDIVALTEDNKSIRYICGVFLFFMIITSGIAFKEAYNQGLVIKNELLELILTLFFFAVLYIPLSSKTKVSNIGIYRNANLIYWKNVVAIDFLKPDLKGRLRVRILYKNNYNKQMTIEIVFKKKMDEYNALKELADKNIIPIKETKKKKNNK